MGGNKDALYLHFNKKILAQTIHSREIVELPYLLQHCY